MRAVGLMVHGGPEVLQVVDVPAVEAGPGQVRIRNYAAAVNPTDVVGRNGMRAEAQKKDPPPYVPGMDAAGIVDQIGEGVTTGIKVGDRVMAMVVPDGTHGAYREQIVLDQRAVVRAPKGTTHIEACTLPMNALTARLSLDLLALEPGQTLAVTGGPGAYGGYVIQLAKADGLATPTIGTINDMICCPGGDYCSLANAKSIPVAEAIQRKFEDLDYVYDLGDLELNISGCMNACGHHHIGHIGILGVDKKGQEWYQIQLGGSANKNAALAKVLGPSLSRDDVVEGIEKLLDVYVENRLEGEAFLATYQRIGADKFKERVYAKDA